MKRNLGFLYIMSLGAFLLAACGQRSEPGAREGGDIGHVKPDPALEAFLASRPRDPAGRQGSGVAAVLHGAGAGNASSRYEGRMFRTGYTGLEPTLGVTSNGWIFYVVTTSALRSQVIRSRDGGASWESVLAPRDTNDPYLWVDPKTDRVFSVDFVGCGLMSFSDDFGESWTTLPPVGCGWATDHQTMYAGPPVSSTTSGYPNVIYYCAAGAVALNGVSTQVSCVKSLDGGMTFLPTLSRPFGQTLSSGSFASVAGLPGPCNGLTGHIFVANDGAVYVPRGVCDQPWLAISRDEGSTWTRVQVSDLGMARDVNGFYDHEATVRADGAGNIFYAWVARDRIPYLAVSRDRGASWGKPLRIAPPDVKETNLPNMDIDEQGRLAFVYMGSTNSPGAPFPNDGQCTLDNDPELFILGCPQIVEAEAIYEHVTWNGYITLVENPLDANPTFASAPVNDPADPLIRGQCGPFRCQAEYDFIDVEFGPGGEIVAALIDGCLERGGRRCSDIGEAVVGALVDPSAPVKRDASLPEGKGLFGGALDLALLALLAGLPLRVLRLRGGNRSLRYTLDCPKAKVRARATILPGRT